MVWTVKWGVTSDRRVDNDSFREDLRDSGPEYTRIFMTRLQAFESLTVVDRSKDPRRRELIDMQTDANMAPRVRVTVHAAPNTTT